MKTFELVLIANLTDIALSYELAAALSEPEFGAIE